MTGAIFHEMKVGKTAQHGREYGKVSRNHTLKNGFVAFKGFKWGRESIVREKRMQESNSDPKEEKSKSVSRFLSFIVNIIIKE